ncbi:Similar to CG4502: Ubiquitin-conjugating enzyme E2Q-like protein CG4502 (Drosophila melanogaster) [Cotesia congregata]|uniref:Transmembrane protein 231 n=1 Tax=Cotesia congregata TaxID=51543 RepID=A0A8J2HHV1_COTCN|nr:Similar to CG4502: Ubiquitin-conjugating enzyme E2Q-like protein CG4502 (Drosophila melanogaster) [Cotesia congregata]
MSTLDVFSTPITYRYKTRVCSIASLVVFILTTALVILPLILAYQSGGFWVRNRVYIETPLVQFTHKYLLIAEGDFDSTPIICSTFSVYQLNPIKDDCTLVKIQQLDINNDKHNDVFKFNFLFYSRAPVKSIKLLFFFQLKLRDAVYNKIDSLAMINYILPYESQKINIISDLKLNQKGLLKCDNFQDIINNNVNNETIELHDHSLDQVLSYYARKNFIGSNKHPSDLGVRIFCKRASVNIRRAVLPGPAPQLPAMSLGGAETSLDSIFIALFSFKLPGEKIPPLFTKLKRLPEKKLKMTTRSKEKVVAAFRKIFRSSEKITSHHNQEDASSSTNSPRRLLGRHRPDAVTPAESHLKEDPGTSTHRLCTCKSKKSHLGNCPAQTSIPERGVRLRRLMKELSEIQKSQHQRDATFTAELVNDNLFEWHVRLHKIDPESELAADMRELNIPHILLHITFPENFPFAPPFMRVISPRIEKGFVMEGGAICMELLTPRGGALQESQKQTKNSIAAQQKNHSEVW